MKNIVLLLVILAIATFAIAENATTTAPGTTPTPELTTTGAPGTTLSPGATTTSSAPSPAARKYALFGTKFGFPNNGSGILLAFHEIGGVQVSFALMHNIANPTAITLHGADAGADPNAATIFTFPASNIAANTLITAANTFTGPQLGWMFDGKTYIKVSTASQSVGSPVGYAPFAGWAYAGILTSVQTTNPTTSNGVGLMIAGGSGQYFSVDIQHNVTDATRITINNAAACQNGAQLFNMPSTGLLASNVFDTATNATFNALNAGQVYAVISNAANTDGAIRGQLYHADYYNSNSLTNFENRACRNANITTTAAPKSSATGIAPSIFLVIVAIIASLML